MKSGNVPYSKGRREGKKSGEKHQDFFKIFSRNQSTTI